MDFKILSYHIECKAASYWVNATSDKEAQKQIKSCGLSGTLHRHVGYIDEGGVHHIVSTEEVKS